MSHLNECHQNVAVRARMRTTCDSLRTKGGTDNTSLSCAHSSPSGATPRLDEVPYIVRASLQLLASY